MIPIATHLISVWRPPDLSNVDPDDPGDAVTTPALIAEDVRAVIGIGGGLIGVGQGGTYGLSETVTFSLVADPCDLRFGDAVEDQATGQRYSVLWTVSSPGVMGMLANVRAGLTTYKGFGRIED